MDNACHTTQLHNMDINYWLSDVQSSIHPSFKDSEMNIQISPTYHADNSMVI